jgi:hypothetical protein
MCCAPCSQGLVVWPPRSPDLGATGRALFTLRKITRDTISGMPLKQLGRQYPECPTSFSGTEILDATVFSFALPVIVDFLTSL